MNMAAPGSLSWLPGQAIVPGAPLPEQIYTQLRVAIVTGRIDPTIANQELLIAEHFDVLVHLRERRCCAYAPTVW